MGREDILMLRDIWMKLGLGSCRWRDLGCEMVLTNSQVVTYKLHRACPVRVDADPARRVQVGRQLYRPLREMVSLDIIPVRIKSRPFGEVSLGILRDRDQLSSGCPQQPLRIERSACKHRKKPTAIHNAILNDFDARCREAFSQREHRSAIKQSVEVNFIGMGRDTWIARTSGSCGVAG